MPGTQRAERRPATPCPPIVRGSCRRGGPTGASTGHHHLQPPTDRGSAVAPHAPPAQTNPVHLGYGCTGWGNHLSIESNGPQRISVSHPGSHFGRFRRPAGYGVMGGRPRRSPHPQEVPQAGSAAQRRPAGARGAGRWPRVVAGRRGRLGGSGNEGMPGKRDSPATGQRRVARRRDSFPTRPFLPKRGLLL